MSATLAMPPGSRGFLLSLGLLAAVPSFGIDMVLPALTAMGATLGVPPQRVGLAMSVFVLGLGVAPLVYGPVSDRYGRKPVVLFGCTLLLAASIGCALANSLPWMLAWRFLQGAGAASTTMTAIAITRDLFEGQAMRAKMSAIVIAINAVPMLAPSAGAALLAVGSWRLIHAAYAGLGAVLVLGTALGFEESARIDPAARLHPAAVARSYLRVLSTPACLGYILVNAAAMGAIFAYATGSALFFINGAGLAPGAYGVVFGASAVFVMAGALLDARLGARGVAAGRSMVVGLALLAGASAALLAVALAGGAWPLAVAPMLVATFAFGLVAPNATGAAMQPLPQLAGAVSAAAGCVQMAAAAVASLAVGLLFDGHSAVAMAGVMTALSGLAWVFYLRVVPG